MKLSQISSKPIKGISIRTTNDKELNPLTSKIESLYQKFDKTVLVDYKNGARVYGVYYNYESDHTGEFSVLAGSDQINESTTETLEQVNLVPGNHLVFEAKGKIPQIVIETWSTIWNYFSKQDTQYKRTYTTDFEFYKSPDEVEIYIAVE